MVQKRVVAFALLEFLSNALTTLMLLSGISFYATHIGSVSLSRAIIAAGLTLPLLVLFTNYCYKEFGQEKGITIYFFLIIILISISAFCFALNLTIIAIVLFFILAYSTNQLISMHTSLLFEKHFNVFEARKFLPFLMGTEELGAMSAAISIRFFLSNYSFSFFCSISLIISFMIICLIYYIKKTTLHSFITNITLGTRVDKKNVSFVYENKAFRYTIILRSITLIFFPCLLCEFSISLEEGGKKGVEFNEAISLYRLYSSICIITFQYFISSYISRYLNITHMLVSFTGFMFFALLLLTISFDWRFLLIAMVLNFTGFNTLFKVANKQTSHTFTQAQRMHLKNMIEGVLKPLFIVFSGIILLPFKSSQYLIILNSFLFVLVLVFAYISFKFKSAIVDHHVQNVYSPHKEECIKAIQALGLLNKNSKNNKISNIFLEFMNQTTHSQIRSIVITALGEINDPDREYIFFEQIRTSNELIQTEVIKALGKTNSLVAQSFLLHSVMAGDYKLNGFSTRMALAHTLYTHFGNHLILMFMPLLNSNNPLIISYAIEALVYIKNDKRLFTLLSPFVFHKNLRIKSSALIILYNLKKHRSMCAQLIDEMYHSNDVEEKNVSIFIIGRLKIHKYLQHLLALSAEGNESHTVKLAYALSHFDHPKGLDLFADLLLHYCTHHDNSSEDYSTVLQHFIRLPLYVRIHILEQYTDKGGDPLMLSITLRASPRNFMHEIEYLEHLWWRVTVIKDDEKIEECLSGIWS